MTILQGLRRLFDKVRVDLLCGGNVRVAAGLVTAQTFDDAAPGQGLGVAGIKPDCLGVVGDCACIVLLSGERSAAIVVSNGELWIEVDGLAEVRYGARSFFPR
jgi:hypothetical protein